MSFAPSTTATSAALSPDILDSKHSKQSLADSALDNAFPPNALDLWLDQVSSLAPPPPPVEPHTPPTSYRAMLANLLPHEPAPATDPAPAPAPPAAATAAAVAAVAAAAECVQPAMLQPKPEPPLSPHATTPGGDNDTSAPSSPSTQPTDPAEPSRPRVSTADCSSGNTDAEPCSRGRSPERDTGATANTAKGEAIAAENNADLAGLPAVERAKRNAEAFTMNQLSRRKRKTPPAPLPGDDGASPDAQLSGPEHVSHRKYQKRLQKNRDSAFVSRIRRREYTRLLENSLTAIEKEKEQAVAAYREMKRRFDVVAAELAGIKTAAVAQITGWNGLTASQNTASPPQQQQQNVLQQQQQHQTQQQQLHARNMQQRQAFNAGLAQPVSAGVPYRTAVDIPTDPLPNAGARGVSTMYMFALVVGVLLPGAARQRVAEMLPTRYGGTATDGTNATSTTATPRGMRAWTSSSSRQERVSPDGKSVQLERDVSHGHAHALLRLVAQDAVAELGADAAERLVAQLQPRLERMDAQQVQTLAADVGGFVGKARMDRVLSALRESGEAADVAAADMDELSRLVADVEL